jgi:hypothetical protein
MPGLLSLSLHGPDRAEVLILVTLPGALGAGLIEQRPRGAGAVPAVTQLRRHVEGASVEAVHVSRRAVRVTLSRRGEAHFLFAATGKPYGAWWLGTPEGAIVIRSPGAPAEAPREDGHLESKSPSELREAGTSVLAAHREAHKRQLGRTLQARIKRLERKRDAILADLERAGAAEELRERASLLLAHAHEIPPGASRFEAMAWDDKPRVVRIDLDPRKSPTELAQELFARSKRMKRGLDVAPKRLEAVEAELLELTQLGESLQEAAPDGLAGALEALGIETTAPQERERKRKRAGARPPYREFVTADGSVVLVGRAAADNDRLTLQVARPQDLWLHARGVTGAHVVVPLQKSRACTPETLVDAATLAAHFSDLRGEPVVDVIYTPRRFVRKRKGSPTGSVTLEREKVLAVRIEPVRLARLLRSEKTGRS